MKHLHTFFFGLSVAFLATNCTGILNKDPLGTLDSGSFFQSADDAVQAINAAYQPLMFSNQNNNFYWAFGELCSDEAITGGDGSRPGMTELDALLNWTYVVRNQSVHSISSIVHLLVLF